MKQRTIHEQRYQRNALMAQLEANIAMNAELLPRAEKIVAELKAADDQPAFFSRTVERLKTSPDPAGPGEGTDSYETMIYHLLLTVYEDVKKKGIEKDSAKMGAALVEGMEGHITGLKEDTKKKEVQLEEEKKEKAKKITAEDIQEGFDSKVRLASTIFVCSMSDS
jgi:cell division cycle protein 37